MPKVRVSKTAMRDAIRNHCLDCLGGSPKEVEDCTAGNGNTERYQCPLHPYRLGRKANKPTLLTTREVEQGAGIKPEVIPE